MGFDVGFLIDKFPYLLTGLKMTIIISGLSIILSLVIGLLGAVITTAKVPILSQISTIYVELFRNTPLLVQIFLLFFGLPSLGITLSAPVTGIIALSLWGGAYAIENFRGGFQSVSKQLIEAGASLGFSNFHIYRYIIVPIGFRVSFSSFSNTSISVLKNSSYLSGIGLVELTFSAVDTISVYFKTLEVFFSIGVIYLLLVWILSSLFRVVERKLDFNQPKISKKKKYLSNTPAQQMTD